MLLDELGVHQFSCCGSVLYGDVAEPGYVYVVSIFTLKGQERVKMFYRR